jgi:DNA primase
MTALDIPALRASALFSSVAGKYLKLHRAGREWKACCPFHEDHTPSFTINDQKGFAHCFGCGWHGDVLDFIQAIERVGLRRAAEILGAGQHERPRQTAPGRAADDSLTQALATQIWKAAVAIEGSPAETYLRHRGIRCQLPETLRYGRVAYGKTGPVFPCLVAAVTDLSGHVIGIQRTFLSNNGLGKANVAKPKLSLGRIRGGAIRLGPIARQIVLCEGIEDGLTLQQELGLSTWVAAGVDNLMSLELPLPVRFVVIGADADPAGERGARRAAERFASEGRAARIIRPLEGHKDFNDELRGVRK